MSTLELSRFREINAIIERDSKDTTYKFALRPRYPSNSPRSGTTSPPPAQRWVRARQWHAHNLPGPQPAGRMIRDPR